MERKKSQMTFCFDGDVCLPPETQTVEELIQNRKQAEAQQMDAEAPLKQNPVIVHRKTRHVKHLVVYTEEDLNGYTLPDADKAGALRILCGNVAALKEEGIFTYVTIQNGDDSCTVCLDKKNQDYAKILDGQRLQKQVSILADGDNALRIKLGPVFGSVGWLLSKTKKRAAHFLVAA